MTAARRLRSVRPEPAPPQFPARPEWAYATEHNRERYLAAIATLRAGKGWLLDRPATKLTRTQ